MHRKSFCAFYIELFHSVLVSSSPRPRLSSFASAFSGRFLYSDDQQIWLESKQIDFRHLAV